jgi:hypothetical protein
MLQIKRVGHSTLTTPDLERMVDYFTNIVGLSLAAREKNRAILATKSGLEAIVLERDGAVEAPRLSFQIAPGSDLGEIASRLKDAGVKCERRSDITPGIGEAKVTKLDRLARSTRDLLNTLATIGERGAGFKSLNDPWADTTTPHGKLMITVLGGLAEFERHLILSRTSEGRDRAKARGVKFGRKPKLTKHQRDQALARKQAGEALTEIAKTYNVSHMTISRL